MRYSCFVTRLLLFSLLFSPSRRARPTLLPSIHTHFHAYHFSILIHLSRELSRLLYKPQVVVLNPIHQSIHHQQIQWTFDLIDLIE